MTATYTFDIFSSLDGYGSYGPPADWGGYWGKQGPELLERRAGLYAGEQRMLFGANTFRQFVSMLADADADSGVHDPWVGRMRRLPATVVSSTLQAPLDWPDARVVGGDAVDVVRAMKQESDAPIRSHGSLSVNWALLDAGLVDRVQVTVFPVLSGRTGDIPIWERVGDVDLELVDSRILDGRTVELTYVPHPRRWV